MIGVAHLWYLGVAATGSLLGGIGWLVRRYRRSAARELQSFAGYIWGTLRLSVGRLFSQALAQQFGIRQYASRSLAAFPSHLPVPSIHHNRRLEIDTAYIRLSLSASPLTRVQDGAILGPGMGSVLVFGEPGSGKSSLTKKLFREVCKQAYVSPFRSRLPVHFELGQAEWDTIPSGTREAGDWLMGLLRDRARVKGLHDPHFLFDAFAQRSGVVVFMDGLDEVPLAIIPQASGAIQKAADDLRQLSSSSVVVVTGRVQLRSGLPRSFTDSFNNVFSIEPFSPADVFAFLRRWPFENAGAVLLEAQRIFVRLKANPTLFDMCTNPLVLAMYVAHDQRYASISAINRLPDNRTDFYQEILNELLLHRRHEQSGAQIAGSQVRRSRQHLLGAIALAHLLKSDDPANSISWRRAITIARKHLRLKTDELAAQALYELGVETGVFSDERPTESIRFMHLTLCEFLAALELSEYDDATFAEVLERASGSDRLTETIVFAIALAGRKRRRATLQRLWDSSAATTLLLHAIRESQAYEVSVYARTLDRATESLSQLTPDAWDAEWFSEVRLVLSCLIDARRLFGADVDSSYPTVSEWLQELINNDVDRLDKVLDLYLTANPAEALQVAQEYGILDRLFDGDRIVVALEQPDFVAFSVEAIQRGSPLNTEWINHLAEAALRHELVAQMLADEPPSPLLISQADSVPQRHAWHKVGPAAGTFYGAVLAIATSHPRWSISAPARKLKRVELIAQLDPRSMPRKSGFSLTTTGTLRRRRSLLRAAIGLEANRGDEWTLIAITFLDISPTMLGLLVPQACRGWAEQSTFSLTKRGLGRPWATIAFTSPVGRGLRPPKAIRHHYTRAPLAQICAVIPFVDELHWVPSDRRA